ncbi:MAG: T9SS type A sorting domain-containing protein [Bacteroidetes bacterium]|nr:T9SS type A sorting domain-containing protein [Bacteroidota bacterium]
MRLLQKSLGELFLLFIFLLSGTIAFPQAAYFFRDSESPGYYDTGLAFKSGASTIDQAGPSGDKIPVESGQKVFQGDHSLRLTWNSKSGGDWLALVIAPGWPFQDISQMDTLSFWVYSDVGISKSLLPNIYMEGAPGTTKSKKYALSLFTDDIPAESWTEIKVPLDTFFNDPNQTNINFSMIKAIIFGQNQADAQSHTLYIDEVKAYDGSTSSLPVATPLDLKGKGYDSHVRLTWTPNTEPHLGGYYIYQSIDNGISYQLRKFLTEKDTVFNDFTGHQGKNLNLKYKIAAVNVAGGTSALSNPIDVSTFEMSDEELLTMVQEATFRYFWNYAEPVSGMARERNTSGDLVTSGGSGFGIMAILVGIERGFISRTQGINRIKQILNYLEGADRFHGAWSHWINGVTGNVIPFSNFDDGGDLVETAFMVQGLLSARSYFDQINPDEDSIRQKITQLWEDVDWNWYRKLNNNVLYWHWSPNYNFQINHQLRGFNEVMITYILAIASPTNSIPASLYHTGWAGNSNYINGNSFYGYPIIVGSNYGGPLFFAHYSYLGFDPRKKKDDYANYFIRNQNHSLINWNYCIANPKGFAGYDSTCWGITASDDPNGYLAHSPNTSNDNGTLSPTAALSSMPYTPEESMAALKYFYRELGDKLWGEMGFYDAFNPGQNWYANSYLAIDQGPIIVMIENHRTELLWDNFMENPEIQPALDDIGFVYDATSIDNPNLSSPIDVSLWPNPTTAETFISVNLLRTQEMEIHLLNNRGEEISVIEKSKTFGAGLHEFTLPNTKISSGLYFIKIKTSDQIMIQKLIVL